MVNRIIMLIFGIISFVTTTAAQEMVDVTEKFFKSGNTFDVGYIYFADDDGTLSDFPVILDEDKSYFITTDGYFRGFIQPENSDKTTTIWRNLSSKPQDITVSESGKVFKVPAYIDESGNGAYIALEVCDKLFGYSYYVYFYTKNSTGRYVCSYVIVVSTNFLSGKKV